MMDRKKNVMWLIFSSFYRPVVKFAMPEEKKPFFKIQCKRKLQILALVFFQAEVLNTVISL